MNDLEKVRRKKKNEDIVKRMREGDTLSSYNSQNIWFPPRPVIKKDKNAMKIIHNDIDKKDLK